MAGIGERSGSADKSSLFADPTLVPTREGEAARREIAEAGEIALALRAAGWIEGIRVDVEHHDAAVHVLVAGRIATTVPVDLESRVRSVVTSVCGPAEITLALADPVASVAPRRRLDLPLGLALFGLGASLALVADRAWRRRVRASVRPRRAGTAPR